MDPEGCGGILPLAARENIPAPRSRVSIGILFKRLGDWVPVAALAVICLAYLAVQRHYFTPACGEPDTAGYLWMADHFAAGRLPRETADDPLLYQSHVWVEHADGMLTAKYAPGFPLAMALGIRLAGEAGAFAINPLAGAMTLIGVWLLFGVWMSRGAAVFATLALAINPIFLVYTGYPLTHALNLALIVWGMYCLWRWHRSAGLGAAGGAGLLLGAATTVRTTSAVLVLVACVMVLSAAWTHRRSPGRLGTGVLMLGTGYLAVMGLYGVYNTALFGRPWITGYALSQEQNAFSMAGLYSAAGWTLQGLMQIVGPLLFGLGLLGMLTARGFGQKIARLLWWIPIWLIYASYYWANSVLQNSFLRFYIATIPVFIGSAFELIDRLVGNRFGRCFVMLVFMGLTFWMDGGDTPAYLNRVVASPALKLQEQAGKLAAAHLPDGAIVLAQYPAAFRLGRGKGFALYDLAHFESARHLQPGPNAPRWQPARHERIMQIYAQQAPNMDAMLVNHILTGLDAGETVAFIVPDQRLDQIRRRLGEGFHLDELAAWDTEHVHWRGRTRSQTWGVYAVRR